MRQDPDSCPWSSVDESPVTKTATKAEALDVINLRLDFLRMVLSVLAGSLPPREAAHAVQMIGERVIERLGRGPVPEGAEEAVAADLAPVLGALRRR